MKPHLENGKSLSEYPFKEDEAKRLRSLQFLTLKGMVVALNCGESNYPNAPLLQSAQSKLTGWHAEVAQLCAKLEGIIPALETAHAILPAIRMARELPPYDAIIVNVSGRGDKDVQQVAELQGQ